MIASASSVSSCAHVALAVRTRSTPRSSFTGLARAAIRVPTAASQCRAATGGALFDASILSVASRRTTLPIGSIEREDRRLI